MKTNSFSIESVLKNAASSLEKISVTSRLDTEILLAHVLKQPRSYLYSHNDRILSSAKKKRFDALLTERQKGKPIAYIIENKEFWSLELKVSKHVLIPRPETELLVELCLSELDKSKKLNIADLGTGSGAIALAIAYERPNWKITAIDKSHEALEIAKLNTKKLNIKNINFLYSNWYDALPQSQKFDAILSNPPYIAENDPHLKQNDVAHEPKSALTSGPMGLDDLTIIICEAKKYLNANGIIIVEHGYNQGEKVRKLMQKNGFTKIKTINDLSQHERVSVGYL